MKTTREFAPGCRYTYDFGLCSVANGWAQLDTSHDASYFGNWINPDRRITFSYCEGDTALVECETDEEFVSHVRELFGFYVSPDDRRPGIDAGCSDNLLRSFARLGLSDLLHPAAVETAAS